MGKYFGTDGFRGRAGSQLTAQLAFKVGEFIGWYFGKNKGKKCRAVIGKDTRLSSYMLEYALAAGVTSSGGDAYIMHVTPTASVSFVARCEGFDCGIMISASHNPYGDNGIKLMNSRGEKLEEGIICLIEDYLDGNLVIGGTYCRIPPAVGKDIGKTVDFVAGRNRYIGHLIGLSECAYKGLKVGLDCANGCSYKIAKSLFDALGAKVYMIGDSPDGMNVNDGCGATCPSKLRELVITQGLDVGFAFDGDADRCICVDERGQVVDGDGVIYILANYLKERGELVGDSVVVTIMSNFGLIKSLKERGITCQICAVGDRYVYEKMCQSNCCLGGEQSGHIILGKLENTGDGLVTAIMVMQALVESKGEFSRLLDGFTKLPQVCESVQVDDKLAVMRDERVNSAIKKAMEMVEGGRVLVRPSGTERVIRIMVEGEREQDCKKACNTIEQALRGSGQCAE